MKKNETTDNSGALKHTTSIQREINRLISMVKNSNESGYYDVRSALFNLAEMCQEVDNRPKKPINYLHNLAKLHKNIGVLDSVAETYALNFLHILANAYNNFSVSEFNKNPENERKVIFLKDLFVSLHEQLISPLSRAQLLDHITTMRQTIAEESLKNLLVNLELSFNPDELYELVANNLAETRKPSRTSGTFYIAPEAFINVVGYERLFLLAINQMTSRYLPSTGGEASPLMDKADWFTPSLIPIMQTNGTIPLTGDGKKASDYLQQFAERYFPGEKGKELLTNLLRLDDIILCLKDENLEPLLNQIQKLHSLMGKHDINTIISTIEQNPSTRLGGQRI